MHLLFKTVNVSHVSSSTQYSQMCLCGHALFCLVLMHVLLVAWFLACTCAMVLAGGHAFLFLAWVRAMQRVDREDTRTEILDRHLRCL